MSMQRRLGRCVFAALAVALILMLFIGCTETREEPISSQPEPGGSAPEPEVSGNAGTQPVVPAASDDDTGELQSDEPPPAQETEEEPYVFSGETDVEIDGRGFTLEDVPESYAEDAVIKNFLYTITWEFDKKYDVTADIEAYSISIENEKESAAEGLYTESYVIHDVTTLNEEQYAEASSVDADGLPTLCSRWEEAVDEYGLEDFEVVRVKYTKVLTEKMSSLGPQWGDGTYARNYIAGRTGTDGSYRIYLFDWPNEVL